MNVNCEIDNIKTLKKGMKITLAINEKETPKVMKGIYNFMDKPVIVDFLINTDKTRQLMKQISPEQRKKIYAILRDMESYTGDSQDNLKQWLKSSFIKVTEYEDFSLSNCSKDLAADFIEYLIRICFKMGVPLQDNPIDGFDNVDRYLSICLEEHKCCICGKPGEMHHWDAIGMGRDRNTYDDSENRKIELCREHHEEVHKIGAEEFQNKYHVYGIIWDGKNA